MQTSKTRAGTLEVSQRTSRKLKTSGSDPDNTSSQNPATRTPVDQSPKVGRRSPRTPSSEKKRPGRVSELESQVAQLEVELKNAQDRLTQSESFKNQTHQKSEDAKKQLAAVSASEDSQVEELEAAQNHYSTDSAALAAAMNEIQKLKIQLELAAESETTHIKKPESAGIEIASLKLELAETLDLVENLKTQLNNSENSKARAAEIAETLRSEKLNAMKAYDSLEDLKAKMVEKDAKLRKVQDENNELIEKLQNPESNEEKTKKLESNLEELKRVLFDKETEMKNSVEEEKDQCGRKVTRVMDQLAAAQAANAEMEGELRRLKVQSDQWRKAAEVAAAMLSGGNGKYVVDSNTKLNSAYTGETEEESPKKRNGNMLKKIGVLLKKK